MADSPSRTSPARGLRQIERRAHQQGERARQQEEGEEGTGGPAFGEQRAGEEAQGGDPRQGEEGDADQMSEEPGGTRSHGDLLRDVCRGVRGRTPWGAAV